MSRNSNTTPAVISAPIDYSNVTGTVESITALAEKHAAFLTAVRSQAYKAYREYGFCSSGLSAFLSRCELPSPDDGDYDAPISVDPWQGFGPEAFSESGLAIVAQIVSAAFSVQYDTVRRNAIEHRESGGLSVESLNSVLVSLGMEPVSTSVSVQVEHVSAFLLPAGQAQPTTSRELREWKEALETAISEAIRQHFQPEGGELNLPAGREHMTSTQYGPYFSVVTS